MTSSAGVAEALDSPTDVLAALFKAHNDIHNFPTSVSKHFSAIFSSEHAFRQIPSINIHCPPESFPHSSLVAFRAMVQDTSSSPEIYLAKHSNGQLGGWGMPDHGDDQNNPDDNRAPYINYADMRECTVIWAVSIPGEASWCTLQSTNLHRQEENTTAISHKPVRPHKYPLPGTSHIGAQVKIYDQHLAEGLKTSDICTFVGVLTNEPLQGDLACSEITVVVPTLHVLFTRETPPTIFPRSFPIPSPSSSPRNVRHQLLVWIAEEALGGDMDAAEWVLLSVIARTQSRTPPIYPPSLTLSHFPPPPDISTLPTLYHVLSLIYPIVNILPLSLATLNKTSFCPESTKEDLHSGWLQVPHGSVYLFAESGITEGTIQEKGIHNLRATQTLITAQTLDYVFPFSRFTFPTDVSPIILTTGTKSAFFQTSVDVPLRQGDGRDYDLYKPLDKIQVPSYEVLNQWRSLVGGSRVGGVTVSDEAAQYIEEDFVKERKAKATGGNNTESGITSDDLVRWMVTARLLALSYHEPLVTKDIWEQTKALEAKRKSRF